MKLQTLPQRSKFTVIFIVTFFSVAVRLIEIRQPFVDAWSWRQSDVAMIAENFYLNGFNIFYPQINWAGNSPGYVGTEFQLVPFIASLLYVIFGVQDWIGRSVSIFFFLASVPFFYLLVKTVSNERSALFAVEFYTLAPLGVFASRSFMPDMASLSFSVIAVYLFRRWLAIEQDLGVFAGLCLATALAILIKLPAVIIGLPLLYMSWSKYGAKFLLYRKFWLYATFSLIPPLAWYIHAYSLSTAHFPHHMFGSGLLQTAEVSKYTAILLNASTSHLTPVTSALMVVGIILPTHNQFGRMFHWWLIGIMIFIVFVGEGSFRHAWYQLPLVPVAAAFAGVACDFAWRRFIKPPESRFVVVALLVSFFAALAYLSYIYVQPLYESSGIASLKAGIQLNEIAPPDALVITADNGDPTTIYYCRRKGWHFPQASVLSVPWPADGRQAINELEKLRSEGGRYLIFTQSTFYLLSGQYREFQKHLDSRYGRIRDTHEYVIFDLIRTRTG